MDVGLQELRSPSRQKRPLLRDILEKFKGGERESSEGPLAETIQLVREIDQEKFIKELELDILWRGKTNNIIDDLVNRMKIEQNNILVGKGQVKDSQVGTTLFLLKDLGASEESTLIRKKIRQTIVFHFLKGQTGREIEGLETPEFQTIIKLEGDQIKGTDKERVGTRTYTSLGPQVVGYDEGIWKLALCKTQLTETPNNDYHRSHYKRFKAGDHYYSLVLVKTQEAGVTELPKVV